MNRGPHPSFGEIASNFTEIHLSHRGRQVERHRGRLIESPPKASPPQWGSTRAAGDGAPSTRSPKAFPFDGSSARKTVLRTAWTLRQTPCGRYSENGPAGPRTVPQGSFAWQSRFGWKANCRVTIQRFVMRHRKGRLRSFRVLTSQCCRPAQAEKRLRLPCGHAILTSVFQQTTAARGGGPSRDRRPLWRRRGRDIAWATETRNASARC